MLDRLIQQALLQVLQPLFDPTFSDGSFGFRAGRGTHDAVLRAREHIAAGHRWVVDMDLAPADPPPAAENPPSADLPTAQDPPADPPTTADPPTAQDPPPADAPTVDPPVAQDPPTDPTTDPTNPPPTGPIVGPPPPYDPSNPPPPIPYSPTQELSAMGDMLNVAIRDWEDQMDRDLGQGWVGNMTGWGYTCDVVHNFIQGRINHYQTAMEHQGVVFDDYDFASAFSGGYVSYIGGALTQHIYITVLDKDTGEVIGKGKRKGKRGPIPFFWSLRERCFCRSHISRGALYHAQTCRSRYRHDRDRLTLEQQLGPEPS